MNKGRLKNILIVILVIITTFSVFKYFSSLKEKYALLNTLNQVKEQLATLEKQRQNLLQDLEKEKQLQQKFAQENSGLRDYLRASKKRLTKLFADFGEAEKTIEQLRAKFSVLEAENTVLREQRDKLSTQFIQVSQENDSLKARLSSVTELKQAIKELQRQMRQVSREIKKKSQDKVITGNRGFLIKDGKSTYPVKIRIEVIPASPVGGPASKE